jgi:hypothetical protein
MHLMRLTVLHLALSSLVAWELGSCVVRKHGPRFLSDGGQGRCGEESISKRKIEQDHWSGFVSRNPRKLHDELQRLGRGEFGFRFIFASFKEVG